MREEGQRTTTAGGEGVSEVIRFRHLPDTSVFVIASIAIVDICRWITHLPRRRDKTVWRCPRLAYHKP